MMVSLLVGAVSFVSAGEAHSDGRLSFTAYCQAELIWYHENGEIQDRVPWSVVVHVDGPYWEILPRFAGPKEMMGQHHEAYSFFMSEEGFARITRIVSRNDTNTNALIAD
ncbi:MAG TPA: hypothetical protein VMS21_08685, partial [Methylomirabilota bacterium]|nr:hypothetical protein [Methylomirabilota bacterium]